MRHGGLLPLYRTTLRPALQALDAERRGLVESLAVGSTVLAVGCGAFVWCGAALTGKDPILFVAPWLVPLGLFLQR